MATHGRRLEPIGLVSSHSKSRSETHKVTNNILSHKRQSFEFDVTGDTMTTRRQDGMWSHERAAQLCTNTGHAPNVHRARPARHHRFYLFVFSSPFLAFHAQAFSPGIRRSGCTALICTGTLYVRERRRCGPHHVACTSVRRVTYRCTYHGTHVRRANVMFSGTRARHALAPTVPACWSARPADGRSGAAGRSVRCTHR